MTDAVNSPPHYTTGGIEAIDYIRAKLGPEGFRAYCLGNVLKYVSRADHKGGDEDLAKAGVYLQWAQDFAPLLPAEESGLPPVFFGSELPMAYGMPFDDEEPPLRSVMGDKL